MVGYNNDALDTVDIAFSKRTYLFNDLKHHGFVPLTHVELQKLLEMREEFCSLSHFLIDLCICVSDSSDDPKA